MKEIHTEIEIQTSDERVWDLVTDFDGFPNWNPFILRAEGKLETGGKLKVILQLPDSGKMTFKPTIIKLEPRRELRWLGHLLIPGLFDGEHIFIIEQIAADKVRFIQREIFSGVLVPLFARKLDSATKRGFIEMNSALKTQAEKK